jgi:hypothetical protein
VTAPEDTVPDDRPRVPLADKSIDLARLAEEVGADLAASDTEVVVADEDSPVTVEQLRAAVDAHTPPPTPEPVPPLTDDEITALRSMLATR